MEKPWTGSWRPTIYTKDSRTHLNNYIKCEIDLRDPTDQELPHLQYELAEATKILLVNPRDPSSWLRRSKILLQLRFPDLAVGDAYKAYMLLEQKPNLSSDVQGSSKRSRIQFRVSKPSKKNRKASSAANGCHCPSASLPALPRSITVYPQRSRQYAAVLQLAQALFFANSFNECLDTIAHNFIDFIHDQRLYRLWKMAREAEEFEAFMCQKDDEWVLLPTEEQADSRYTGAVMMQPYPWVDSNDYERQNCTIEAANRCLDLASGSSCAIQESLIGHTESMTQYTRRQAGSKRVARSVLHTVRHKPIDLDGSRRCRGSTILPRSPTSLGLFATRDIPAGTKMFTDVTAICAIDDPTERCTTCCGLLSHTTQTLNCCGMKFCGSDCRDLTEMLFHTQICGTDVKKYMVSPHSCKHRTQDSLLTEKLLFRILCTTTCSSNSTNTPPLYRAMAEERSEPWPLYSLIVSVPAKKHPLRTPFLNQLTPTYHPSRPHRFSLTDDIIRPIQMLQTLGIDVFADDRYDTWVIRTIQARVLNNTREHEVSECDVSDVDDTLFGPINVMDDDAHDGDYEMANTTIHDSHSTTLNSQKQSNKPSRRSRRLRRSTRRKASNANHTDSPVVSKQTPNYVQSHESVEESETPQRTIISLNPLYSFLNHSCDPNVELTPPNPPYSFPPSTSASTDSFSDSSPNSTLSVYAKRPLLEGEELYVSYLAPEDLSLHWRERSAKMSDWTSGKGCACSRCTSEKRAEEDAEKEKDIRRRTREAEGWECLTDDEEGNEEDKNDEKFWNEILNMK